MTRRFEPSPSLNQTRVSLDGESRISQSVEDHVVRVLLQMNRLWPGAHGIDCTSPPKLIPNTTLKLRKNHHTYDLKVRYRAGVVTNKSDTTLKAKHRLLQRKHWSYREQCRTYLVGAS